MAKHSNSQRMWWKRVSTFSKPTEDRAMPQAKSHPWGRLASVLGLLSCLINTAFKSASPSHKPFCILHLLAQRQSDSSLDFPHLCALIFNLSLVHNLQLLETIRVFQMTSWGKHRNQNETWDESPCELPSNEGESLHACGIIRPHKVVSVFKTTQL